MKFSIVEPSTTTTNAGREEIQYPKLDFSIYPNPAKDKLYLDGDLKDGMEIKIFDPRGRLVYFDHYFTSSSIDISQLEKGIYVISITSKLDIGVTKFIKQ